MDNPWKEISLSDYENHMRLCGVRQLQTLNGVMKEQFDAFPASSVMILGVAGGNGLEHADARKYGAIYGIDVNPGYLEEAGKRHRHLGDALKLLCVDLTAHPKLPHADLLVADLLIEYIGYDAFSEVVKTVQPRFISCVIQVNEANDFVSESPYLHAFDGLAAIHHQTDGETLVHALAETAYKHIFSMEYPLPNGKKLLRLDFSEEAKIKTL